MAKAKRAKEAPASTGMDSAMRLWGRGNVFAARRASRNILDGEGSSAGERAEAEGLLRATSPDQKTRLIAFGAVLLLVLVLVVLKVVGG
jgi:hypothetical protein